MGGPSYGRAYQHASSENSKEWPYEKRDDEQRVFEDEAEQYDYCN
jgi:hypothetical protein